MSEEVYKELLKVMESKTSFPEPPKDGRELRKAIKATSS
jgi:hypothetical protein